MRRRWSPRSRVFAALAVIAGLSAYLVMDSYAKRVEALAPALGEPTSVLVATRDLARGTKIDGAAISTGALAVGTVPGSFAPPGALRTVEGALGRTLLADLAAGEVLTRTRLSAPGGGPLASLVPDNRLRAFTVATSLPPGAVAPGDRVDVLATFAGGRPYTDTVGAALEVLLVLGEDGIVAPISPDEAAADAAAAGAGSGGAVIVVLLVSPEQAERLAYARAFADLAITVLGGEEVVAP